MKAVAEALGQQIFGQAVDYQLRALLWNQHVEAGHVPFRRDCRICQEAAAKGRPHRKVQHPLCGTLSVDTTGPFKVGIDYDVKTKFRMKYMLVGAFTWLKPEGGSTDPEDEVMQDAVEGLPVLEEEAVVDDVDHEGDLAVLEPFFRGETVTLMVVLNFSSIRMEKDIRGPEHHGGDLRRGEGPEGGHPGRPDHHGRDLHREEGDGGELRDPPRDAPPPEERKDPEINVYRLCIPMVLIIHVVCHPLQNLIWTI